MKKLLCMLVAICLVITSFGMVSFAADEIKIVINDKPVTFDQMPVIVDGRTLVPLRGISETLGAEVLYTAETKRVTVTRDGVVVKLKIGSNEAYVDREMKTLDVPATKIFAPASFISLAFSKLTFPSTSISTCSYPFKSRSSLKFFIFLIVDFTSF